MKHKYIWVVKHKDIFREPESMKMILFTAEPYWYNKLKFGDLVTLKLGYIVKAKTNYLGYVVKKGKTLTLKENIILFNKIYKKVMNEFENGKMQTDGKEDIVCE